MARDHFTRQDDKGISKIHHAAWNISEAIGGVKTIVTCNRHFNFDRGHSDFF